MKPVTGRRRALGAVLGVLGALAVPGHAQEVGGAAEGAAAAPAQAGRIANGTQFGRWTLSCEAIAVGETACVLSQRIVRGSDNAFLTDILMFANPQDAAQVFLAARVPEGVYLPAGFALRSEAADDAAQRDLTWQACAGGLCEALTVFSDDEVAALEDGGAVIAGFRPSLQSEPLVFRFSMEGARAGLDALRARAQ